MKRMPMPMPMPRSMPTLARVLPWALAQAPMLPAGVDVINTLAAAAGMGLPYQ